MNLTVKRAIRMYDDFELAHLKSKYFHIKILLSQFRLLRFSEITKIKLLQEYQPEKRRPKN